MFYKLTKRCSDALIASCLIFTSGLINAEEMTAEQIYLQNCTVCHGDDGSGNMPGVPDLADSKTLMTEKKSIILEKMKSGIQSPGNLSMPPRGGNPKLTDEQLLSVLNYMRQIL